MLLLFQVAGQYHLDVSQCTLQVHNALQVSSMSGAAVPGVWIQNFTLCKIHVKLNFTNTCKIQHYRATYKVCKVQVHNLEFASKFKYMLCFSVECPFMQVVSLS